MTVFFSLLPIYIFGNLHCAGMCGPLVMLLARHPHKWWYFGGRLFAFTTVGILSAEMGMVLFTFLAHYHISAVFSLLFGLWIVCIGSCLILKWRLPGSAWLGRKTIRLSTALARLSAQNSRQAIFLFGTCTVLLPCGQTLIVFSVIALNATPLGGLINGALFALFTSPALIAAMRASSFFYHKQKGYHLWVGYASLTVGALALLRGFADLDLIRHFILNPSSPSQYHIVFF